MKVWTLLAGTTIQINGVPYRVTEDVTIEGNTDLDFALRTRDQSGYPLHSHDTYTPESDVEAMQNQNRADFLKELYGGSSEGTT